MPLRELSIELNAMMEKYPKNFRMGVTSPGEGIVLRRPSFDCNWYWSFGYLGNKNCHYHLSGLDSMDPAASRNHLRDQLKAHFKQELTIKDDKHLWQFCEVSLTIYTLKKMADLYHLGGSHTTTNPDAAKLKDLEQYTRIVRELIPMQIESLYAILAHYPEQYRD